MTDIEPARVKVGDKWVDCDVVLWAIGVAASPLGKRLGVETDKAGRIPVNADLSVKGLDGVYALGDTALCLDRNGAPLPALGQVAKQQGEYLGRALARFLHDQKPMKPFRFRNRGNAGIIGRNAAFFDFGSWRLTGFPAWILWAIVHVWGLVGFENRRFSEWRPAIQGGSIGKSQAGHSAAWQFSG